MAVSAMRARGGFKTGNSIQDGEGERERESLHASVFLVVRAKFRMYVYLGFVLRALTGTICARWFGRWLRSAPYVVLVLPPVPCAGPRSL